MSEGEAQQTIQALREDVPALIEIARRVRYEDGLILLRVVRLLQPDDASVR